MKKRTIALMLSVLAVMMLVGVGFATWVISQGAGVEETGSLVVEAVTDNRLNVSIALKAGDDGHFNFTAPEVADEENKWLTATDDHSVEKKSVTFVVTVTKQDGSAFEETNKPVIKFTLSDDAISATGLVELVQVVGTEYTVAADAVSLSGDSKTASAEITIEYEWGNVFDASNPYTFFNAKSVGASISAQDATDAGAAGLTYGNPAAALSIIRYQLITDPTEEKTVAEYEELDAEGKALYQKVGNNYGDLAHAALEKLYAQNTHTVKVTVAVSL